MPSTEDSAFMDLLRSCAAQKDLCQGTRLHAYILKRGLLKKSPLLGNALMHMYAKCAALVRAKGLLFDLPVRDVSSWNTLVAGYVQHGQAREALSCLEWMKLEGLPPNKVTFTCALKACGNLRALDKGSHIHDEISRQGLLGKDIMLGTALVDMYAKCGALAKARHVFEEIPGRDVVLWSAIIAGYVQHGYNEDALDCFEQMQHEGVSPNAVTFACILKACGSLGAVDKGQQIHDEIARQGVLESNTLLSNALVDMYAKCGAIHKAHQVLEKLPTRDVFAWSALIAGYIEQGQFYHALDCFECMRLEGLLPDAVTFVCILKACGVIGAVERGEQIHDEIVRRGLLKDNVLLGNALVDMYGKCCAMAKARQVLENLPSRNVVSWNALIAGYSQAGEDELAVDCYEHMQQEGLTPDEVTFTCILKACGNIGAADMGVRVHEEIIRQRLLESSLVLGNALIDMYVKCHKLLKAQEVFENLPVQNVISWNALIAGYAQQGQGRHALHCFEQMQCKGHPPDEVTFTCVLNACGSIGAADKGEHIYDELVRQGLLEDNIVLGNALVDMYAKCGALAKAQQVLAELPGRDVFSWTALISGYVQQGKAVDAVHCFEQMQHEGVVPNVVTYISILKAYGAIEAADRGGKIHDEIIRQGLLGNDIALDNALIDMCVKCGALARAREVLEELSVRNVVTWNILIAGYIREEQAQEALSCYRRMRNEALSPDDVTFTCTLKACGSAGAIEMGEAIHDEIAKRGLLGKNNMLDNALVDMYVKCCALAKARQVVQELPICEINSWNAVIAGYSQHGCCQAVLDCLDELQFKGMLPNEITYTHVVRACGSTRAVDIGEKIHDDIVAQGFLEKSVALGNAIVHMYVKFGALCQAEKAFAELYVRDVVSWSALVAGYALYGQAQDALICVEQMQCNGLSPNAVTFSCLLNACNHSGLVDEGQMCFVIMSLISDITPDLEHYTCMVDILGRAGHFDKALKLIQGMPYFDHPAIWSALLSACGKWGDSTVGRWAFKHVIEADKCNPPAYVCMANIYGMQYKVENSCL